MSIDTELIVQILKRSPQGLTPLEILNHLINESQYQGFSKSSIFSKLLPKLNELRDLQKLVQVSPRWLLSESTEDMCQPDVLVESSSQSDCLDYPEPSQDLEPSIDESMQFNEADQTLSDDAFVVFSDSPIEVLKLSLRTYNCLKRKNINTVNELQNCSDIDLMNIKNFGQISLDEVRTALSNIRLLPQPIDLAPDILLENIPEWTNLPSLQILTNDRLLLVEICNSVSLSLRKIIRKYSATAHLVIDFEADQIALGLDQRIELARILNPLRILRNASQNYLDWLSCLPVSILIDILVKRQWTPERLREVYPQQILSVTPHDFRYSILQDIISGKILSKYFLTISEEIDSIFDSLYGQGNILKQRLGFQNGIQRTLEDK